MASYREKANASTNGRVISCSRGSPSNPDETSSRHSSARSAPIASKSDGLSFSGNNGTFTSLGFGPFAFRYHVHTAE